MKKKNNGIKLLIIGLVVILVGSAFACYFNTGQGSVSVDRISFETENGTLSGLLYMPDDASADNPKPTIIVTHGYLNSAEMQDANAIELARRGFVVLALDQYDHGHSDLNDELYSDTSSFFGLWLPFWYYSMYDAVEYMYQQDYVLKDSDGNGIIGVTGHSMGGFSSTVAVALDEYNYYETGYRMIYACLTEGSDFSYTAIVGIDAATFDSLGGGRILGKVAAQYDEFFFNNSSDSGTVRQKDYVSTEDGLTFLQQTSAEAGIWYSTSDGGMRIIYQPAQTHPWNHFSKETTGYAIDFYQTAFADYSDMLTTIDSSSQIWQLKEVFECVALVGFVIFLIGVAQTLLTAPFFSNAVTGEAVALPAPKGGKKAATWVITIIAILLPAIFFVPLMDEGAGSSTVNILFGAGLVVAVAGIVFAILSVTQKKGRRLLTGSILMVVSGAALAIVTQTNIYGDYSIFSAIGINGVAYWTITCALISACVMSTVYVCLKQGDVGLAEYGISYKPKSIIAGICTGLLTVVIGYAVLFIVDAIFTTDFRIWTFAFKTFDADIIPTILKYLPTFALFYVISSISIAINTNTENTQGIKGYLLAIVLNAGGAILWLIVQYGMLFATGEAAYPDCALSGIILIAMVPTLSIAAIISRNLYKKSGNIWTAATLNALLMTIMTVANTMVALK